MLERAKSRELPLVLFTLALQLSSGLVLAATLCRAEAGLRSDVDFKSLTVAALAIAAFGLLASVLHLGRPLSAWRSLTNLRQSRLSLEILLTGLYLATCAGFAWAWQVGDPRFQLWSSAVTSIIGVAAVIASAAVYMLPGQPPWNANWVLISFLGTTLTLGGAASAALVISTAKLSSVVSPISMMLVGAVLVTISAAGLVRSFRHVQPADTLPAPHSPLTSWQRWILALHVGLVAVVPFALAAQSIVSSAGFVSPTGLVALAALVAVLTGAFLGRALMYSLVRESF